MILVAKSLFFLSSLLLFSQQQNCCCLALHLNSNKSHRLHRHPDKLVVSKTTSTTATKTPPTTTPVTRTNVTPKAASLLSFTDQIKQWTATTVLGISLLAIGSTGVFIEPANAAAPASITTERTKIELNVETDYLVRVLEYFDGDMKRTLGAVVRSPYSSVSIDPPNSNARDALLRSLYSFEQPDDYQTQASWLSIQPTKNPISKILDAEYTLPGGIRFNNLQVAFLLTIFSYPFAFGYYKYEAQKEEEAAAAKRAAMAAKREKAAAKAAAAKKADEKESTTTTNTIPYYGEEG